MFNGDNCDVIKFWFSLDNQRVRQSGTNHLPEISFFFNLMEYISKDLRNSKYMSTANNIPWKTTELIPVVGQIIDQWKEIVHRNDIPLLVQNWRSHKNGYVFFLFYFLCWAANQCAALLTYWSMTNTNVVKIADDNLYLRYFVIVNKIPLFALIFKQTPLKIGFGYRNWHQEWGQYGLANASKVSQPLAANPNS